MAVQPSPHSCQVIRALDPADRQPLHEMLDHLTPDTLWLRYRQPPTPSFAGKEADRLSTPDVNHTVLVAVSDEGITAIGELVRDRADPGMAHVAMVVRDEFARLHHMIQKSALPVRTRSFGSDLRVWLDLQGPSLTN